MSTTFTIAVEQHSAPPHDTTRRTAPLHYTLLHTATRRIALYDIIPPTNGPPVHALVSPLQVWYYIEPPSKTRQRMVDRRDKAASMRGKMGKKTPAEKKVRPGKKGRKLAK